MKNFTCKQTTSPQPARLWSNTWLWPSWCCCGESWWDGEICPDTANKNYQTLLQVVDIIAWRKRYERKRYCLILLMFLKPFFLLLGSYVPMGWRSKLQYISSMYHDVLYSNTDVRNPWWFRTLKYATVLWRVSKQY